uniref:Putative neurotoxin 513V5 n=1 Tax=Drysdalia coronoides TaxID=66186 RepID=F8QZ63_DRYCN|nr:putative neurotoxin 513V5 [Drysdalia coronoides]AEH05953.1 putative neurotoxin 513V5 [Drysdalia coronoides]
MKTLLLTLVVVAIMCLDVGYTLKCRKYLSGYVVCKENETICYRYTVSPFRNRVIVLRGCSASCPGGNNHVCCSTDMCN